MNKVFLCDDYLHYFKTQIQVDVNLPVMITSICSTCHSGSEHLEGWDVLYNHPECYITKSECYITILEMLYNTGNCYITHVI